MLKFMYAIYDQATQAWLEPFCQDTDAAAERQFLNVISNVELMRNAPADFDLYVIGTFSTRDGTISAKETVQKVVNGLSLVQAHNQRIAHENAQVGDVSSVQSGSESRDTTL
ncbi:nonstructural protein [Microviridae sp.]|nr:nonstructural protein [Microviridae sp.]